MGNISLGASERECLASPRPQERPRNGRNGRRFSLSRRRFSYPETPAVGPFHVRVGPATQGSCPPIWGTCPEPEFRWLGSFWPTGANPCFLHLPDGVAIIFRFDPRDWLSCLGRIGRIEGSRFMPNLARLNMQIRSYSARKIVQNGQLQFRALVVACASF